LIPKAAAKTNDGDVLDVALGAVEAGARRVEAKKAKARWLLTLGELQLKCDLNLEAAQSLDFERASVLRDQLRELKELPELVLVDSKKKKRDFIAAKKQKKYNKKATSYGNSK